MHDQLLYIISAIVVLGVLAQWASWRLRLPAILALLIIGLLAGPITGLLNPDEAFGDLMFPFVSLGVALVLFEGGLTLKIEDIRGHGSTVTNLVTWGALLNWLLIASGVWWLTELSMNMALLFAALVVVTGPTVINPLLRTVRPNGNIRNILHWEGILIDPVGALLAVLVFQYISAGGGADALWIFVKGILVGTLNGTVIAILVATILLRHWVPEYLKNTLVLGSVVLAFSASQFFAHESGLLAVTIMGMILANIRGLNMTEILHFKESLSVLIISLLFIVLAARVDVSMILATGWQGVAVIATVLVARFLVVWVTTIKGEYRWQEKFLIAWIGPRGIVAAAVSSLFALRMEALGYTQAPLLVAFTFLVIIVTVSLQSLISRPLAKMLNVAEGDSRGVLIVGANKAARAVAHALKSLDIPIKIASNNWSDIKLARMDGLNTYYGNPISADAEANLDLVGIGNLYAMSDRPALNTLSSVKYRMEFSLKRIFTLRNEEENDSSDKYRPSDNYYSLRLFGEDMSVQQLEQLIDQGAEIKSTLLTESFSWEDYKLEYKKEAIFLFCLDTDNKLQTFTDKTQPIPTAGWTVTSMISANKLKQQSSINPPTNNKPTSEKPLPG